MVKMTVDDSGELEAMTEDETLKVEVMVSEEDATT